MAHVPYFHALKRILVMALALGTVFAGFLYCYTITYRIILPDGYVGWVRVDFELESAPELALNKDNDTAKIVVPESGFVQTSTMMFASLTKTRYLMFYQKGEQLTKVPKNYYSRAIDADGVSGGADDYKDGRTALSWYFFVGPKSMRAQYPPSPVIAKSHIVLKPGRINNQ